MVYLKQIVLHVNNYYIKKINKAHKTYNVYKISFQNIYIIDSCLKFCDEGRFKNEENLICE